MLFVINVLLYIQTLEPTAKSLEKFYSNKYLNNSLNPDYNVKKQIDFFKK